MMFGIFKNKTEKDKREEFVNYKPKLTGYTMNKPNIYVGILLFLKITPEEAKTFLNWYVASLDERVRCLERTVQENGMPNWKADYSTESLRQFGEWFVSVKQQLTAMRDGLPTFSYEAESISIDMSMYMAIMYMKQFPDIEIIMNKSKNNVEYQMPVLALKRKEKGASRVRYGSTLIRSYNIMYGIFSGKNGAESYEHIYKVNRDMMTPGFKEKWKKRMEETKKQYPDG